MSSRRRWHFSALGLKRRDRERNDWTDPATLSSEVTSECLRPRYEAAVVALRALVTAMRSDGASSETIARTVHTERRRLTAVFKALTPEPWRSQIHGRTLAAYGDPVGPTIKTLRTRGKSWDDITASATRPGSLPSFDTWIDSA